MIDQCFAIEEYNQRAEFYILRSFMMDTCLSGTDVIVSTIDHPLDGIKMLASLPTSFLWLLTRVRFDNDGYRLFTPGACHWIRYERLLRSMKKKKIFYGRHAALGWLQIAPYQN